MRMTGSYGDQHTVTRCTDSPTSPYRDGPYSHTAPDRTEEAKERVGYKDRDAELPREKEAIRNAIKQLAKDC
jgi:hypothetical protein